MPITPETQSEIIDLFAMPVDDLVDYLTALDRIKL
jgi:hypothetical protein